MEEDACRLLSRDCLIEMWTYIGLKETHLAGGAQWKAKSRTCKFETPLSKETCRKSMLCFPAKIMAIIMFHYTVSYIPSIFDTGCTFKRVHGPQKK